MSKIEKINAQNATEQNPNVILAHSIIAAINELSDVMSREVELVARQDMKGLGELLPRKHKAMANYLANMQHLAVAPESFAALDAGLRKQLLSAGQKLEAAGTQNIKTLQGAVMATRRLIDNIIAALRKETKARFSSYIDPRNQQQVMGSYSPTCDSIAIRTSV